MTRINVAIPVENLTDQHLLAEHREIKRLPSAFSKKTKPFINPIKNFCLGTGHVNFFLDKGLYTFTRYCQIYKECLKRGFEVENYSENWKVYDNNNYKNWTPKESDRNLIIDRISQRINESKQIPRYYGQKLNKDEAIKLLQKIQ